MKETLAYGAMNSDITQSIAQVGSIGSGEVSAMLQELQPHLDEAQTNYDDYQNGKWKLLALYNNSGDSADTAVRENEAVVPTPLLEAMPTARKVINGFFPEENIVLARIARLNPGGRLWEHVDYTELNPDVTRLRFHIPLKTEAGVDFATQGSRIHMAPGNLWMLNPRGAHGVIHEGKEDRIHMIIDATVDDNLRLEQPHLDQAHVTPLPEVDARGVDRITNELASMIRSGGAEAAVDAGLNLFYTGRLPKSLSSHLVIAAAFQEAGDSDAHATWLQNHDKYMGGGFRHD